MYAYKLFENGKEAKKAKGIKKNVVEKEICFEDFKKCLLTKEPIYKKEKPFRTQHHDIHTHTHTHTHTVEQNKMTLSASDD
jgi:hypothetical protein